ncbi:splicing factor U2af large subunit B [Tanacetum coccineum]
MEVASAFGPIKAYHFKDNANPDSPCAFVEYADQSVAVKACAGLNGIKLGWQVITVTQATPDASSVENNGEQPSYGTPLHARPLLETPMQVLKLTNQGDGSKWCCSYSSYRKFISNCGSTLFITGGLVAQAQSAATLNRSIRDEDKVTLSEVLTVVFQAFAAGMRMAKACALAYLAALSKSSRWYSDRADGIVMDHIDSDLLQEEMTSSPNKVN